MKHLMKKIRSWWRSSFRKRRFNMLNATDNSEEWHVHLSPAGIFAAFVAFALVLFIAILSLVAYTPVLEFLPGYRSEAGRSREDLIQNIIRIDSMERMMNDMMTYNRNIARILEGKTPVARTVEVAPDSARTTRLVVVPSREDSLLRAQMEGSGEYALSGGGSSAKRQVREAIELVTPVEGIITGRFDIKENSLGVRIAAAAEARITAIDNGTVVQSLWTPENGYTVIVQHAANLLSVYKNLSQSLVTAGQAVRSGDQLGYNSPAVEGEVRPFEFELWSNGKPVDPEGYIVF